MSSRRPLVAAALGVASLLAAAPARADPCVVPSDCDAGFCVDEVCCDTACDAPCQACSKAAKGGGTDGTCGLATAGTVCAKAYCSSPDISYYGPSTCDSAGNCNATPFVDCLKNQPCKLDLCDPSQGCGQVVVLDGTSCDGGVCTSGMCGPNPATSSSASAAASSSGGTGGKGAGGAAGTGGMGGGAGAGGGKGSASTTASGSIYPPAQPGSGCHCTLGGDARSLGGLPLAVGLGAFFCAHARRRQKRRSG